MPSITVFPVRARVLAVAALAVGSQAVCGGASPAAKPPTAVQARFVRGDFGLPGRGCNRFLPLEPGIQWVRLRFTDVGHRRVPDRVISTVTGVTRLVDGVRAVAVHDQDIDAGQLAEYSIDYSPRTAPGRFG
ncbi:MAG: hypothetical protein ACR2GZ_05525 [Solirubrobacteraceae bacterium]